MDVVTRQSERFQPQFSYQIGECFYIVNTMKQNKHFKWHIGDNTELAILPCMMLK